MEDYIYSDFYTDDNNELKEYISSRLLKVNSLYETLATELQDAEVGPVDLDYTWEAWLHRIEQWGKVSYEHYDPEIKRKEKIYKNKFLVRVKDPILIKALGGWNIQKKDVNKVRLERTYYGLDSKKYTEWFLVTVDFKPELKRAMRRR